MIFLREHEGFTIYDHDTEPTLPYRRYYIYRKVDNSLVSALKINKDKKTVVFERLHEDGITMEDCEKVCSIARTLVKEKDNEPGKR